jgi:hypothetical protein
MNLDAEKGYLDQAERALPPSGRGRRESEMSFLQELLRELGADAAAMSLSPADLFRAVRSDRRLPYALQVLAAPSQQPEDALRAGDWLLRAVPGSGDVGHVSVLASGELLTPSTLASEGIAAEGTQPGYYGLVIEAGAFAHDRSRRFARRLLDGRGRVPPHTVVLRPRYRRMEPVADLPPDEPEPDGAPAADLESLEEFAGCPLTEDVEIGEQARPQQAPVAPVPSVPDSALAARFVAAHPSRYCRPGQTGSGTCQALAAPSTVPQARG